MSAKIFNFIWTSKKCNLYGAFKMRNTFFNKVYCFEIYKNMQRVILKRLFITIGIWIISKFTCTPQQINQNRNRFIFTIL